MEFEAFVRDQTVTESRLDDTYLSLAGGSLPVDMVTIQLICGRPRPVASMESKLREDRVRAGCDEKERGQQ
jgi:hypothetical protein